MAPLHAPGKFLVHLVLCTAFHLHKQLDKTSCSGFFCSLLCLLLLLIFLLISPFESLQCVRCSCSSPPHKHTCPWTFFGNLCSNSQGCAPANSLCVGVPGANYQLLTRREISRVEEALEISRECFFWGSCKDRNVVIQAGSLSPVGFHSGPVLFSSSINTLDRS